MPRWGSYVRPSELISLPGQARSGSSKPLPFAIMTSDDTHARTEDLLKSHSYFGMLPEQVGGW